MSEPLIAKWLEDRDALSASESAELIRLLESDPDLARSVKDQLALDHLLSLRLAVDRRNFEQQVAQRIRNAGTGTTFEQSTMEAVKRANRRPAWRVRLPEAAAAALLLAGLLFLLPRWSAPDPTATPGAAPPSGLRAEYFPNRTVSGKPVVRIEPSLDFSWPPGAGPIPALGDVYSARWTGTLHAPDSERFTFRLLHDDGVRLWIDGKLLIDDWTARLVVAESRAEIDLKAGRAYAVKVEYYNGGDRGVLKLLWSTPTRKEEAVPASAFGRD